VKKVAAKRYEEGSQVYEKIPLTSQIFISKLYNKKNILRFFLAYNNFFYIILFYLMIPSMDFFHALQSLKKSPVTSPVPRYPYPLPVTKPSIKRPPLLGWPLTIRYWAEPEYEPALPTGGQVRLPAWSPSATGLVGHSPQGDETCPQAGKAGSAGKPCIAVTSSVGKAGFLGSAQLALKACMRYGPALPAFGGFGGQVRFAKPSMLGMIFFFQVLFIPYALAFGFFYTIISNLAWPLEGLDSSKLRISAEQKHQIVSNACLLHSPPGLPLRWSEFLCRQESAAGYRYCGQYLPAEEGLRFWVGQRPFVAEGDQRSEAMGIANLGSAGVQCESVLAQSPAQALRPVSNASGKFIPSEKSEGLAPPALAWSESSFLGEPNVLVSAKPTQSFQQNLFGQRINGIQEFFFELLRLGHYSSKLFLLWGFLKIWKGIRPVDPYKNEYQINIRLISPSENKKKLKDVEGIEKYKPTLVGLVNTFKKNSLRWPLWAMRAMPSKVWWQCGWAWWAWSPSATVPSEPSKLRFLPAWFGIARGVRGALEVNPPGDESLPLIANKTTTQYAVLGALPEDSIKPFSAVLPKGYAFVGKPGTGKTLLAQAVAGEAGVLLICLSASEIQKQLDIGTRIGALRIRNLFKIAKKNTPCILFLDEIDSIGGSRKSLHVNSNLDKASLSRSTKVIGSAWPPNLAGKAANGQSPTQGLVARFGDGADYAHRFAGRLRRRMAFGQPRSEAEARGSLTSEPSLLFGHRSTGSLLKVGGSQILIQANQDFFTFFPVADRILSEKISSTLISLYGAFNFATPRSLRIDTPILKAPERSYGLRSIPANSEGRAVPKLAGLSSLPSELVKRSNGLGQPSHSSPRWKSRMAQRPFASLVPPAFGGWAWRAMPAMPSNLGGPPLLGWPKAIRRQRRPAKRSDGYSPRCPQWPTPDDDQRSYTGGFSPMQNPDTSILTEFLIQMDTFCVSDGFLVIGSTNFLSHLDSALIRSGRFDRIIGLQLPTKKTRISLLQMYTEKSKLKLRFSSPAVHSMNPPEGKQSPVSELRESALPDLRPFKQWEKLAKKTQGFSAADLAQSVNESSLYVLGELLKTQSRPPIGWIHKKPYHTFKSLCKGIQKISTRDLFL
jgi:SpoVK/Ycf46/Vps4 family AAA+-type ATPase